MRQGGRGTSHLDILVANDLILDSRRAEARTDVRKCRWVLELFAAVFDGPDVAALRINLEDERVGRAGIDSDGVSTLRGAKSFITSSATHLETLFPPHLPASAEDENAATARRWLLINIMRWGQQESQKICL